jgi:dCTP deaminase
VILSDDKIHEARERGEITIEAFDRDRLGSNSYDVRLGRSMLRYTAPILDAAAKNAVQELEIPPDGIVLVPNQLYLGVTMECVGSTKYVPWLDGKSSAGRLGTSVHVTAGRGDIGFIDHWTMEIWVVQAVKLYAGMPIAQFTFMEAYQPRTPYNKKAGAKYGNQCDRGDSCTHNHAHPWPRPSAMWKNFPLKP